MEGFSKELGNAYGNRFSAAATADLAGAGEGITIPKVPDKKFKAGGLTATVWKSISQKGTTYYNVQLGKSYKDKDNNWKTTSSLRENEVPKAMVLLQKAYEYVIMQTTNSLLS